jgi:hypothetical protein
MGAMVVRTASFYLRATDLKAILSLCSLTLMVGSVAIPRIPPSFTAHSQTVLSKPVFETPVEMIYGLPTIRLTLNGHPNQLFLIDTGMPTTAVSEEAVKCLKLKIDAKKSGLIRGVGDAEPVKFQVGKSIKLSFEKYDLYHGLAPVFDLAAVSSYLGQPLSGVVGFDILSHNIFVLDYKRHTFSLYPKGASPLSDDTPFDLISCDSEPTMHVRLNIGGSLLATDLKLDTGSNAPIEMNSPFVTSHELLKGHELKSVKPDGLGGEHVAFHGETAELLLADRTLKLSDVYLSQAAKGATALEKPDGSLGSPALEGHTLVFECPAGKIELH